MIKKYNYKIAGIASFAGIAMNNVKAEPDNGKLAIKIDDDIYTMEAGKIECADFNGVDAFLKVLETKKEEIIKDSSGFKGDITKENYFVKSVKENEVTKIDKDYKITLTANTVGNIELVSKENRINITYAPNLKGARLTKKNEEKILANILQGNTIQNTLNAIKDIVTEFKIDNVEQSDTAKVIGSNDIKLFGGDAKINFEIKKIEDGAFKTVVCKFADATESQLVKGLDLEKLCDAFKTDVNGLKQTNRDLTNVLTGLNECQVESTNTKFFKDLTGVSIKKDGSDEEGSVIKDNTKKDFNDAKFVVVEGIKKENINPMFLKKTFEVQFDEGTDNKTISTETINLLNTKLKEKLEDTVKITGQVIFGALKEVSGIKTGFNGSILINNAPVAYNATNDLTTNVFTIKLKSDIFDNNVLKNKINLTFDFTNIEKNLKTEFKNAVNATLGKFNVETTVTDILNKLNTDLNSYLSEVLVKDDITINPAATVDNVNNNSNIKFTDSGINKLKDYFEEPQNPKKDDDKNNSSEGSGDKSDSGKNSGKKCCNSGKENK